MLRNVFKNKSKLAKMEKLILYQFSDDRLNGSIKIANRKIEKTKEKFMIVETRGGSKAPFGEKGLQKLLKLKTLF